MFTTLLGPLPRPPLPDDAAPEAVLDAVLAAQVEAGLEPLTDGGWPLPATAADPVAAWRATAARTDRLVKAVVLGPLTLGRPAGDPLDDLRAVVAGLADAGCAFIEVAEPAAASIGEDPAGRAAFVDLHHRLLDGFEDVHLSLAITGGSAHLAGAETILAPRYASLAVDLIAGPDNWYLVRAAPADRGIVCGVVGPGGTAASEPPELLVYAAGYAASGDRGIVRVGLATASSFADLSWDLALRKLGALHRAAELIAMPTETRLAHMDPRAVDARSAALGRYDPVDQRRPAFDRPPTPPPTRSARRAAARRGARKDRPAT